MLRGGIRRGCSTDLRHDLSKAVAGRHVPQTLAPDVPEIDHGAREVSPTEL
jgi:hypothetical protein